MGRLKTFNPCVQCLKFVKTKQAGYMPLKHNFFTDSINGNNLDFRLYNFKRDGWDACSRTDIKNTIIHRYTRSKHK